MIRPRPSALLVCAVFPVLALSLVSCTSYEGLGERHARDDADEQAAIVGRDLERAARSSRDLEGVTGSALQNSAAELLVLAGDLDDVDTEPHVEIRVTGHTDGHTSNGIGDDTWPQTTLVRCYRFSLDQDQNLSATPEHLRGDCAGRVAIPVPDPPEVVDLTEDDLEFLHGLLSSSDRDVTGELRARFPDEVNGVDVDVAELDGTLGVGLLALDPGRDCLLGRRLPDGSVEVWFPPAITVAPGEASCDATTAAAGGAQRDPH